MVISNPATAGAESCINSLAEKRGDEMMLFGSLFPSVLRDKRQLPRLESNS
jgi:hypothetical protein